MFKDQSHIPFLLILASLLAPPLLADDSTQVMTPELALKLSLKYNPEAQAQKAMSKSDQAMIRNVSFLENPKLGIMQDGPESMRFWSLSQEVLFPSKYFAQNSAQNLAVQASNEDINLKNLEIRSKALSTYYKLFTLDRTLDLLKAQRETLREIARAAESRHATGTVPQQDEMKAHVEQTMIENELILMQSERDSMSAMFNMVLAKDPRQAVILPQTEWPPPKLSPLLKEITNPEKTSSSKIKKEIFKTKQMEAGHTLAKMSYLPDFMLSYKRSLGATTSPSYTLGVELSIPLWFYFKQESMIDQASANVMAAQKNLEQKKLEVDSDILTLSSQVKARDQLLQIYQTSLIPQAQSTLRSSHSAYQAGKIRFLELLDSERALYQTRITYYQIFAQFIDSLTKLEELSGTSLSDLPKGDLL